MALSGLSASPSESLYVGDSLTDAQVAQRGGVRFAAVCSGTTTPAEFAEFKPHILCESVTRLPEFLK